MMQSCRRREHSSSSGELDVFGATSYFAGCVPEPDDRRPSSASATTEPSADRLYFQAKVVQHDMTRMRTTEDNSFRSPHQQQLAAGGGLHDHAAERYATNKQQLLQVVAAKRQQPYSGKSKLAALLSFMVSPLPSPSPRTSFRKEAPSTTSRLRQAEAAASAAAGCEKETAANNNTYKAANSPPSSTRESSSMQLQGLFGAHHDDDDDELDLGVATGDRRLQGITVVRGGGSGEERWVVRCVPGGACWDDEEHREKMLVDAAESSASSEQNIKDEQLVEVERLQGDDADDDDDGNIDPAHSSWDSDSSSDLFDLDLEYR